MQGSVLAYVMYEFDSKLVAWSNTTSDSWSQREK